MSLIRSSDRSLVYYSITKVIEDSVYAPNTLPYVVYDVIETLIGQLNDKQLKEVEDIIVNQFGED